MAGIQSNVWNKLTDLKVSDSPLSREVVEVSFSFWNEALDVPNNEHCSYLLMGMGSNSFTGIP